MSQPVNIDAEQVIRRLSTRIGDLSAELAMAQAVNETLTRRLEESQVPPGAKGDD